jgi:LPXTG-motif cell wall-anchored protein
VPVPLLVLGGLSLALLAAGGLGYVSRRRQAANGDTFGDDDTVI